MAVSSSPATSSLGARYISSLDGLRALSVLLVFGAHSVGDLVPGGFIGVDVFFVLSGFLITSLLAGEWMRLGTIRRGAFYARRALRLYPALILLIVLTAVLTLVTHRGWWAFTWESITTLTYTFNFYIFIATGPMSLIGHVWSLCVEEQYYLVWPLVLLWLLRRGGQSLAIKAAAIGIVASICIKAALVPVIGGIHMYFLPFGHADELLIGSLVGLLLTFRQVPKLRRLAWGTFAPWACVLGLLTVAFTEGHIGAVWLYLGGLAVIAVATATVVAHLTLNSKSLMARLLNIGPAQWLGRRSYAFYLFHQPIIIYFRELGLAYRYVIPAALAVTCLLVGLSWKLEQRVLRLKHRFELPRDDGKSEPESADRLSWEVAVVTDSGGRA